MIGLRAGLFAALQTLACGVGGDSGVTASTSLTATITDSDDPVQTSTPFSYAVVVVNPGANDAISPSAVITLDSHLTVGSASGTGWTCGAVGNVVTCTRSSLAAGATAPTITINATSPATYQTVSTTGVVSASNVPVPVGLSSQTEIIQWVFDAAARQHFPASDAEFTRFKTAKGLTVTNPNGIYNDQEASGNMLDSGPNPVTLTVNASPSYQQPVTGYTRTFWAVADASSARVAAAAGVGPNPATTSSIWLGVYSFGAAPSTTRIFMGPACNASATGVRVGMNSSGQLQLSVAGVGVTATPDYSGGNHLVGVRYDRAHSEVSLLADLTATAGTYNGAAITDQNKGILTAPNSGSGPFKVGYGLRWDGANAEANTDAEMAALAAAMNFHNTAPATVWADSTGQGHADVTVLRPANYSTTTSTARPLLIMLGGYGSPTGTSSLTATGWNSLVSYGDGAIIMPLTGLIDSGGNHYWNADPTAADIDGGAADSALYVRAAIDWAISNYNIDLTRVFVVGRSNGGFLAHAMAAKHSDVVTAIVDIGGQGRSVAPLTGASPVHALIDHSVADPSVDFYGVNPGINGVPYMSTAVTLAQRAAQNGSSGLALTTAAAYDHDSAVAGNETDRWTYSTNTGATTEHWREATSGHLFAFTTKAGTITTNWGQDAWDWLMAHPRI